LAKRLQRLLEGLHPDRDTSDSFRSVGFDAAEIAKQHFVGDGEKGMQVKAAFLDMPFCRCLHTHMRSMPECTTLCTTHMPVASIDADLSVKAMTTTAGHCLP
jgi:hypothetical protein